MTEESTSQVRRVMLGRILESTNPAQRVMLGGILESTNPARQATLGRILESTSPAQREIGEVSAANAMYPKALKYVIESGLPEPR